MCKLNPKILHDHVCVDKWFPKVTRPPRFLHEIQKKKWFYFLGETQCSAKIPGLFDNYLGSTNRSSQGLKVCFTTFGSDFQILPLS